MVNMYILIDSDDITQHGQKQGLSNSVIKQSLV